MNHLKVLWIDCSPFCGGAQKSFGGLIRTLLESYSGDISGHLFYAESGSSGWGKALADLPGLELRYCRCRHWSRSIRGLFQLFSDIIRWRLVLMRELREFSPDLIHVNTCRGYLLLPWLFCMGIPVLVHDRDFRKPGWLMRLISWKKHLAVLTVSRGLTEAWRRRYPRLLCEYWPNPVAVVPDSKQRERRGKIPFFVMIADWADWKNHSLFVRALACYCSRYGLCRGVIQGRVHDSRGKALRCHVLALQEELGLKEVLSVEENCEVSKLLGDADVLVSCSEEEPFGRTVVEALQHGCCVVAGKSGGPSEILAGCRAGFLTDGGPAEFACKMHEAWLACGTPEVFLAARSRGMQFLPAVNVRFFRKEYDRIAGRLFSGEI